MSKTIYEQAKEQRDQLESRLATASAALNAFPRLPNGLTPDAIKTLPDYQVAKSQAAVAFRNLREFNQQFVRLFKHQIKLERKR